MIDPRANASSPQAKTPTMHKTKSLDFTRLRGKQTVDDACCGNGDSITGERTYSLSLGTRHLSHIRLTDLGSDSIAMRRSSVLSETSCHQDFDERVTTRAPDNRRNDRTMTAGRLSVVFLMIVILSEFLLSRGRGGGPVEQQKPSLGLGSAAIGSITDTLSPILPFTGGVDLRREEHWDKGWLNAVSSVALQLQEAFFEPKSDHAASPGDAPAKRSVQPVVTKVKHEFAMSATEPFVSLKDISEMTLSDVSVAFQYAVESTKPDFNENKFTKDLKPEIKKMIVAMNGAVAKSRGKGVAAAKPFKTKNGDVSGDVDALFFCAAMRIFAEWRILRLVPDGYKGYAVGMNLGHKDVVQNVAKIEQAAHDWLDYHNGLMALQSSDDKLRSPTLRELLEYEVEMDVHSNLPRLKDKTAGMGLLWVRRQLQYQTSLFGNILKVPSDFSTTTQAVEGAYKEVYDKYHGWAVQKIFMYSFQAAPEDSEIFKFMNPRRLEEVMSEVQSLNVADQPTLGPVGNKKSELNPLQKAGLFFQKLLHGRKQSGKQGLDVRGGSSSTMEDQIGDLNAKEVFVVEQMKVDAKEHIRSYLYVAEPLLRDIAVLFKEQNMDDPTKV